MTIGARVSRVYRRREPVKYAPSDRVPHTGLVAHELAKITGYSVTYCQLMLSEGTHVRLAGQIIQAHVNAGDLGQAFVKRVKPIERAFANVPHEAYCIALELAEQEASAAQDLEQTRYLTDPSVDNARRRIRTIDSHIARLQGVERSIAQRHGLRL